MTLQIGTCVTLLCLGTFGQTGGQTRSGAPSSRAQGAGGSIQGRVLKSRDKQPLAGIDVFLVGSTQRPPARTGPDGGFLFDRLAAGRYSVMLHPRDGYRVREPIIVLREGQKVADLRILAYTGASISGQVRDKGGRPIVGLVVSAIRLHGAGPRFAPDRGGIPTSTNDLGEYKIQGLNPGRYAILAETRRLTVAPKHWGDNDEKLTLPPPAVRRVSTYFPDAATLDLAAPIEVQEGQVLEGMDVTIAAAETFCVRSRVLGAGSRSGQIRIQVTSDLYMGAAILAQGELAVGSGFEVCGLPAGTYSLLASTLEADREPQYATESFAVTNRSLRVTDLSLRPLIPLAGLLTIEGASASEPLPGAVVINLNSISRPLIVHEKLQVQVAKPGPFVVPAVLPAEYWLNVRTPTGFYVNSATMDGRDAMREPLHAAGRELHIIIRKDGSQLTVRAVDSKDAPVPGASVLVGRDPLPFSYTFGDLVNTVADQDGQAAFPSLAPGKYRVVVLADTPADPASAGPLFLANRIKGETVELAARESRSLSVRALDRRD